MHRVHWILQSIIFCLSQPTRLDYLFEIDASHQILHSVLQLMEH